VSLTDGSERFRASQRLKNAAEFARVFSEPHRSTDIYFVVLARRNEGTAPRLGLAISRRAARRAHDRNRIKRLVRETFRRSADLPPWDFVVMAKPTARATASDVLTDSLRRHFKRLGERAGHRP
jgi:ribonuclease P protein component